MPQPTIYLIAGCNGAGKTTFAWEFLPREVKCLRFYNADEIARGLSPLKPSTAAIKAGRLLLQEVHASISKGDTFALESTLSGRTISGCCEAHLPKVMRSNFITCGLRHRRKPSHACASACAWVGTMFPSPISGGDLNAAANTSPMIIFPWQHAGRYGTVVRCPQNCSLPPTRMI